MAYMNSFNIKIVVIFVILSFILVGCSSQENNEQSQVETNDYSVKIVGNTTIEDGLIICDVAENTVVDINTYLLSEDHKTFVSSMGIRNMKLDKLDYIGIRNNYSEDRHMLGDIRLAFYCHNTLAISNETIYDEMKDKYGGNLSGIIYLDRDYQLTYDEEKIIGFQILKQGIIDDDFVSTIKKVTLDDLTELPEGDNYTVILITAIFTKPN